MAFTDEQKDLACSLYLEGLSTRAVGERVGASCNSVCAWLRARGIKARPQGKRSPALGPRWSLEERDEAARLYAEGLGLKLVGDKIGWSADTVAKMLDTLGIERRTPNGFGPRASRWAGGRTRIAAGYVMVHTPDHPHATPNGYVYEHRLVMEQHIGRQLERSEVVHHKNGNNADNRIENLELFESQSAHGMHHAEERRRLTGAKPYRFDEVKRRPAARDYVCETCGGGITKGTVYARVRSNMRPRGWFTEILCLECCAQRGEP